jgi:hypothetical protein
MFDIVEDAIAAVYKEYTDAGYDRLRSEALYEGAKKILRKLHRYLPDDFKFRNHSSIAINELSSYLNRFYHYDTPFIDRLLYEARTYIIEMEERWRSVS